MGKKTGTIPMNQPAARSGLPVLRFALLQINAPLPAGNLKIMQVQNAEAMDIF